MPFVLHRLIPAQWVLFGFLLLSTAWSTIAHARHSGPTRSTLAESQHNDKDEESSDSSDSSEFDDKDTAWPPIIEQRKSIKLEFINSIDQNAIRALASQHNHGKPCTISDPYYGSFNVCFVIQFDTEDTKWVVRVPIMPVVQNA